MYLSIPISTDGKLRFEDKSKLVPEPTAKARRQKQSKASKLLKKYIAKGINSDDDENTKN